MSSGQWVKYFKKEATRELKPSDALYTTPVKIACLGAASARDRRGGGREGVMGKRGRGRQVRGRSCAIVGDMSSCLYIGAPNEWAACRCRQGASGGQHTTSGTTGRWGDGAARSRQVGTGLDLHHSPRPPHSLLVPSMLFMLLTRRRGGIGCREWVGFACITCVLIVGAVIVEGVVNSKSVARGLILGARRLSSREGAGARPQVLLLSVGCSAYKYPVFIPAVSSR